MALNTISTTLRIVDTSGNELLAIDGFSDSIGRLNSLDWGYPNIRDTTTPISGAHGNNDTTRWFADRPITAEVTLPAGPAADVALDTISQLMNPYRRLYLYGQRPGWTGERRILVRAAGMVAAPGVLRQIQLNWIAPGSLLEDSVLQSVTLNPQAQALGGMSVPMTVPLTLSGGSVSGSSMLAVGGTMPAQPIIDMYGPCTDPLLRCTTSGKQIVFTGMTIADGDYLHVDMGLRQATLNNDPSQSRYSQIDLANSTPWFDLPVGSTGVIFSPNTPSGSCQAVVSWRNRYI